MITLLTSHVVLLRRDIYLSAINGPVPKETLGKLRCSQLLDQLLFSLSLNDIEKTQKSQNSQVQDTPPKIRASMKKAHWVFTPKGYLLSDT